MDDIFLEKVQSRILDFATDKRAEWERQHKLYSVIFELTPRCNFNCVHCYLNEHHASKELSYDEIIEIIDILYDNEVLFLTFTGGDIFTRADFIQIYMYAKKKGFIIELYTNGTLITDEIIEVFKQYPHLLVDISLYGSCEETYYKVTNVKGAFNKVLQNIQKMLDAKIRVSVKAPVLNLYYDELPQIKNIAEDFGVPFRTGFEIFPSIDYEGRMCPCMSFRHVGKRLTRENFERIWSGFRDYPRMRASEAYKCLRCKAYDFCDICPAMMQFVHGDLEHIDEHFCVSAKARYEHYIKGTPTEVLLKNI